MSSDLRVMSFNVWRGGGRGLDLTIEVIRRAKPDVAGLQECSPEIARSIAEELGVAWVADVNGHAILSPHEIVDVVGSTTDEWGGLGATLEIRARGARLRAHVFDAHLHWTDYGPYALHEQVPPAEVIQHEHDIRMPGLEELLGLMLPALASGEPTFLVGDFNAPSHLDYRSELAWPESLACAEHGLEDSWRAVHPDLRRWAPDARFAFDEAGVTWSPIVAEEVRGVFDRIDFVYHAPAGGTVAASSVVLDERNSVAPWPSDHRAVVSSFSLR